MNFDFKLKGIKNIESLYIGIKINDSPFNCGYQELGDFHATRYGHQGRRHSLEIKAVNTGAILKTVLKSILKENPEGAKRYLMSGIIYNDDRLNLNVNMATFILANNLPRSKGVDGNHGDGYKTILGWCDWNKRVRFTKEEKEWLKNHVEFFESSFETDW